MSHPEPCHRCGDTEAPRSSNADGHMVCGHCASTWEQGPALWQQYCPLCRMYIDHLSGCNPRCPNNRTL